MKLAISIIQFIMGLGLIAIVVIQSGKKAGLSGILGGSDGYMSKGQAKTLDTKLAKLTPYFAGAFIIVTFALTLLQQ